MRNGMRSESSRATDALVQRPLWLLLWTALASSIFAVIGFGEIVEDAARTARTAMHPSKPSGDIVFVRIDDKSLARIGQWPWPRTVFAKIVDEATRLDAKKVVVDIFHDAPTRAADDAVFARSIERSGRVVLPARERVGVLQGRQVDSLPLPELAKHASVASVSLAYNYQNSVLRVPLTANIGGRTVPSLAAAIAGVSTTNSANEAWIDYSIESDSIPEVSAWDLMTGRVDRVQIAGKTLVIGSDAEAIDDSFWVPGRGRTPGAIIHILAAETLRAGTPTDLGFIPALLLSLAICAVAVLRFSGAKRNMLLGGSAGFLLIGPALLEVQHIYLEVTPGLFAIAFVSGRIGWLHWRSGGMVNALSGLPNLTALRVAGVDRDRALIAARVHNFAEITATLQPREELDLVRQMVQRLTVSGGTERVYQGDEGTFAWFADPNAPLGNHVEALHSLFRSPLTVGSQAIDVAITFGVELGSGRALANRLGSALVAADDAWTDGLKWKYHDPARQEEAGWRLSLLGQLDAAIDNGEVWVAYQPQYHLSDRRIVGAEALARWTHPQKGPISPTEFIAAAEQNGRIAKITDFVLDRAIATAAAINRRGVEFNIAVNISARLLGDAELISRIIRLLHHYKLAPERLTLELTETAAISGVDGGLAMLDRLRDRGVRIAIDDYGTGLSTLEYLKKVPANEIKIDQSFVKAMKVNRSDLIMVQSTIALAHSLGRTVVAEGVEDRSLLDQLAEMGCDIAQGYAVGRPMGVRELVQRLQPGGERKVA